MRDFSCGPLSAASLGLVCLSLPAALQAAEPSAFVAPATAAAQSAPTPPAAGGAVAAPVAAAPAELPTVVITGNPLRSPSLAQPAQALTGEALLLRRASTLGETLDGLPGVAASWFGPNSNRPVIRGLDGDRVRLLDNAGASLDASSLSFDHAVALDPLVVERVEVLRGPASLLYGGNATGGVVNTMDNRIPRDALSGLGGRAELRAGGAASERSASVLLEGGTAGQGAAAAAGLNWHVDAFSRDTGDLRVPRFTPQQDGEAGEPTSRVRNSAAQASGGALGVSWADAQGFFGASLDGYRNDYGVTVEPDVLIRMQRGRLNLAGERKLGAGGFFTQVSGRLGHTRYQHEEVEGSGEVGTTFRSSGQDLRLEAQHAPLAGWRGVWGVQAERLDFEALGVEAFVPGTRTRSLGLFALEQTRLGDTELSLGLRAEQVRVDSDGDAAEAEEARFGAASQRRFTPLSASLGGVWPLGGGWSGSATLGLTQRAPAYYELYANGLHIATGAYERGDASLGVERRRHLDAGVQWQQPGQLFKAHAYVMRFTNYIALEASGQDVMVEDEDTGGTTAVPEYVFHAVPAQLWGLELQGQQRFSLAGWRWDAGATLDLTRGENRHSGEALPRLAPWRLGLTLQAHRAGWRWGVELRHAGRQSDVPAGDVATPGYTLLNASLSLDQRWNLGPDGVNATWFLKLDNLSNELAYSATALRTVRELAPLPGRSALAGLRVQF